MSLPPRIIPDTRRITAHWERRNSRIPDWLAVPMPDGTIVRYVPAVPQPAPGFVKESMDRFDEIVGYKFKYEKEELSK